MNLIILREKIKKNKIGVFFLYIASIVYILFFNLNRFIATLFRKKINKDFKLICIGNISCGGTGKTTVVMEIAKKILLRNKNIAIIMRGYKSKAKKNEVIESNYYDINNFMLNEKASDEQRLMTLMLQKEKIPILASKNKKLAINTAYQKYFPQIIISDDGFQNFWLKYDYSIILVNPNQINEKILPLGNLREPYSAIKRADAVIINHCELFEHKKIKKIEDYLSNYISKEKIFKGYYIIDGFDELTEGKTYPKDFFSNKDVAVFSGIGDNEQFINYIKNTGANPIKVWKYPDHYNYKLEDLKSIENLRDNLPIITTTKDAVKIFSISKEIFKSKFYVARISMVIDERIIDNIINLWKYYIENPT